MVGEYRPRLRHVVSVYLLFSLRFRGEMVTKYDPGSCFAHLLRGVAPPRDCIRVVVSKVVLYEILQ